MFQPRSGITTVLDSIAYCYVTAIYVSVPALINVVYPQLPCQLPFLLVPTSTRMFPISLIPFPCRSLSLLPGPVIPVAYVHPTRPPLGFPIEPHMVPLVSTRVSSDNTLPQNPFPVHRPWRLDMEPPTLPPFPSCGRCMWLMSASQITATPLRPPLLPVSHLWFSVPSSSWYARVILCIFYSPSSSYPLTWAITLNQTVYLPIYRTYTTPGYPPPPFSGSSSAGPKTSAPSWCFN